MEGDALYFRISKDAIKESEEKNEGLIVDYDVNGNVGGMEILNIKYYFKLEMPTVGKVEV